MFYTAPTAIRSLIKAGGDLPKKYDLSSLRILGTVGEPINPEAWMWYHETVGRGRCPIVDTWWQTETGGHMISPLPGRHPTKPGSCDAAAARHLRRHRRRDRTTGRQGRGSGILVISRPWPAMLRTIWGDPDRYVKTYWPDDFKGKLLPRRRRREHRRGRLLPHHRTHRRRAQRLGPPPGDDGDRIGAGRAPRLVAEAAVVGRPDDLTGEAVVAFVVLKGARPTGAEAKKMADEAAQLGGEGDRPDRQAQGHPLRRQPAEDALGQDHAAPAALDRQGRGNHAGRLDAGEPRDPRAAQTQHLTQDHKEKRNGQRSHPAHCRRSELPGAQGEAHAPGLGLTIAMLVGVLRLHPAGRLRQAFPRHAARRGVTTIGMPIGLAVIVFTIVITGIYVRRANSEFDLLSDQIAKKVLK